MIMNPVENEVRRELAELLETRAKDLSTEVGRALDLVPRSLFRESTPLAGEDEPVSGVHLQAILLDQADIEPGMSILVIGSRDGYGAALARELAGERGQVTAFCLDEEALGETRTCLDLGTYDDVSTVEGDLHKGVPELGPYDRIIASAPLYAIPAAWTEQLAHGGRIVGPLNLRGAIRSVAWERDGEDLVSEDYRLCGYLSGTAGPVIETLGDLKVCQEQHDDPVDLDGIREALDSPPATVWTEAACEPYDELELYLLTVSEKASLFLADRDLMETGLVTQAAARGVPALIAGDTVAYLTWRGIGQQRRYGAVGHGPRGDELAERLARLVQDYAERCGAAGTARLRYTTDPDRLEQPASGMVLRKSGGAVTISWPAKPTPEGLGIDPDAQAWKRSGSGDGAVMVAFPVVPGRWERGDWVLVRAAGDAESRTLVFDRNEWECFLDGARKGEFDDAAADR